MPYYNKIKSTIYFGLDAEITDDLSVISTFELFFQQTNFTKGTCSLDNGIHMYHVKVFLFFLMLDYTSRRTSILENQKKSS